MKSISASHHAACGVGEDTASETVADMIGARDHKFGFYTFATATSAMRRQVLDSRSEEEKKSFMRGCPHGSVELAHSELFLKPYTILCGCFFFQTFLRPEFPEPNSSSQQTILLTKKGTTFAD